MTALLLMMACSGGPDPGKLPESAPGDDSAASDDSGQDTGPAPACADQRNDPLTGDVCVSDAACSWSGEQDYEYYGWVVASGADLDGDGVQDALIGAPVWDAPADDGYGADAGRTLLVSGAALARPGDGVSGALYGVGYAEGLGTGVILAGDVNGDGWQDVVLGAHGDDTSGENAGAAWLVEGTGQGWEDGPVDAVASAVWTGESEYARVGRAMAGGADLNGDGLSDLILTGELSTYDGTDERYRGGRATVVLGAESLPMSLADADLALDGADSYGGLGKAEAMGDVDGDGYADALIAAPYAGSYYGRVYLLPGGAELSGWSAGVAGATALGGEATYDAFGWNVAISDLNADGMAEMVVAAPLSDRAFHSAGAVWIYQGSSTALLGPEEAAVIEGPWDDWELGTGLATGGDLDGDGYGELEIGAVDAYTGLHTKSGREYLFRGGDTLPSALSDASAVLYGADVKDYLGQAAALGDLDADGYADLLVGGAFVNTDTAYDVGTAWVFWGAALRAATE